MGKQSRKQRKHLRVKHEIRHMSPGRPTPSEVTTSTQDQGWSTWPLALKLLLVGIAALVVVGLYRRYTEDAARNATGASVRDVGAHGR